MTSMTTTTPRYFVRRTLYYAQTVYGYTDDLGEAQKAADNRTILGYPSEVIDTITGQRVYLGVNVMLKGVEC